MAEAEKKVGHEMQASFKKPKGHPVDYFVPNFGQDEHIKTTLDNLSQAETDLKHTWVPVYGKNKPAPHPVDYFVPNFGVDKDIMATHQHLNAAEKTLGHKWNAVYGKNVPAPPPRDYFVPNFGQDKDIIDTQDHIKQTEKKLNTKFEPKQDDNGNWIVPEAANNKSYSYKSLVQLESDPICSSAGCNYNSEKPGAHPMNYFVPNFGADREHVVDTHGSLLWAEKALNHKWDPVLKKDLPKGPPKDYFVPNFGVDEDVKNVQDAIAQQEKKHGKWSPKQDENGVWLVPEPINNAAYSYNSLVQLDSDPVCSSAGCMYGEKATHPMDYKVPNFGQDHIIKESHESLDWAEKNLGKKWIPNLEKQKPKPEIMYDNENNKPLDGDMTDSLSNLKSTEKKLGNWKLPQEMVMIGEEHQSDPICDSAHPECKSKKESPHPVDYKVPNFGVDHDIIDTQKHMADQEKKHGKWEIKQDANGKWNMPKVASNL